MKTLMTTTALSAAGAILAMGILAQSPAHAAAPEVTDELLALGEKTYMRECSTCHGVEGDGEGPGAYILSEKPRNFQLATYKFRSTPNGEVPLPEDLFKTITNGLIGNGAAMPAFKSLSEEERGGFGALHHPARRDRGGRAGGIRCAARA